MSQDPEIQRRARDMFDASHEGAYVDLALAIDQLVKARVALALAEQRDPGESACSSYSPLEKPARNDVEAAILNLRHVLRIYRVGD